VDWNGKTVETSIWKAPVEGRVRVKTLNVEGDQQADLLVHGGPDKAVYVYPSEHYSYWQEQLQDMDLPWGVFGENFTTQGLLEHELQIGDGIHVGSARFVVKQPRMPCFKLGMRFGNPDMIKRFLQSGRTGFYFAVVNEGEVAAGDSIDIVDRETHGVTVSDIVSLYATRGENRDLLLRATRLPALPEGWRDHFRKLLKT